jgi:hypothetical protein
MGHIYSATLLALAFLVTKYFAFLYTYMDTFEEGM